MIDSRKVKPIFFSIHIRKITKFVLFDILAGSALFFTFKNVYGNYLLAFGTSTLTIEAINLIVRRTNTGRKLLKGLKIS